MHIFGKQHENFNDIFAAVSLAKHPNQPHNGLMFVQVRNGQLVSSNSRILIGTPAPKDKKRKLPTGNYAVIQHRRTSVILSQVKETHLPDVTVPMLTLELGAPMKAIAYNDMPHLAYQIMSRLHAPISMDVAKAATMINQEGLEFGMRADGNYFTCILMNKAGSFVIWSHQRIVTR